MTSFLPVVGRYAPSPTGDLHLGNLRTALLAWLHARQQGGQFLLRMEDLDLPRVVDGSADQILRDLRWLGLDWDGPVIYQSKRTDIYQHALNELRRRGQCYACFCSRKDIRLAASAPHSQSGVYPGICRNLPENNHQQKAKSKLPAIRIKLPNPLQYSIGDFVIKRADGLFAYQLAVTVDDLDQGVTEVVRGEDLRDSQSKQLYLASQLNPDVPPIKYLHTPLMLDTQGRKMSKRDGSDSLREWQQSGKTAEQLLAYLAFTLGIVNSLKPISMIELISLIDDKILGAALNA